MCRSKVKVEKMIAQLKKVTNWSSFNSTRVSVADTGVADHNLYEGGRQGAYEL